METVLSNEVIADYLSNHQRRRAFLRFCGLDLLRSFHSESKAIIDAKEEEELARMALEEEKSKAIAAATEQLIALGVTPQEVLNALSSKPPAKRNRGTKGNGSKGSTKNPVKKTAYRHPDTGHVIYWARRGQPPKELEDLVQKYGKEGLEQFIVK